MRPALCAFALLPLLGGCVHRTVTDGHLFQPGPCAAGVAWPAEAGGMRIVEGRVPVADTVALETITLVHPDARATLVYFGGNSLRHCPAMLADAAGETFVEQLHALRLSAVLVNYRGYGGSSGRPTFEQGRADAVAVFDEVARGLENGAPLLVHGQSLGSVFATHVALERPVAALVLESAPTTIREVLHAATPWYVDPFLRLHVSPQLEQVDHRSMAGELDLPVLLVTGSKDRMTPPRMARELGDAIGTEARVVIVDGGSHGDLVEHRAFWAALAAFLDTQLDTQRTHISSETGRRTPDAE